MAPRWMTFWSLATICLPIAAESTGLPFGKNHCPFPSCLASSISPSWVLLVFSLGTGAIQVQAGKPRTGDAPLVLDQFLRQRDMLRSKQERQTGVGHHTILNQGVQWHFTWIPDTGIRAMLSLSFLSILFRES